MVFCKWLISLSIILSRYIPFVSCIHTILFFVAKYSHCMDRPHFIYPLISWWTFGVVSMFCFFFDIMNNVFKFLSGHMFVYFSWVHTLEFNCLVTLCLTFWGTAKLFLNWLLQANTLCSIGKEVSFVISVNYISYYY